MSEETTVVELPDDAGKPPVRRHQVIKYLAEQFPRATLADHQLGADGLLAIFGEWAARVRAEAVADERQRLADAILPDHWQTMQLWGGVQRLACGRCRHGDGVRYLWPCPTRRAITGEPEPEPNSALLAAGSVPVATPDDGGDDEPLTHEEVVACLADVRGEPDWAAPTGGSSCSE